MNKQSNIFQIITFIPIVLYAFGFIIHCYYLSQYSFINFSLFQAKYIYIGFNAAFIICAIIIGLLYRTDLKEYSNNFKFFNLFSWIFRLIIIILWFFVILSDNQINEIRFFNYVLKKHILILILFPLTINIMVDSLPNISKHDILMATIFIKIQYILSFPLILILICLAFYNRDLFDIIIFITLIWLYICSAMFGKIDAQRGFFVRFSENELSETPRTILSIMFITIMIFTSVYLLKIYASKIYPKIPSTYGGGRPINALIIIDNDSLHSKIIDISDQWIIYLEDDSTNSIIRKIEDVDKIIVNR